MRGPKRLRIFAICAFFAAVAMVIAMIVMLIKGYREIPIIALAYSVAIAAICLDCVVKKAYVGLATCIFCVAGAGLLMTFAFLIELYTFAWGILIAISGVLGGVVTKNAAADRDHTSVFWFAFGFICLPIAMLVALALKPRAHTTGYTQGKISRLRGNAAFSHIEPWLYLAPFLAGLAVFTLYPVVNVIFLSFKEDYSYLTGAFDGWSAANYSEVLTDKNFAQALRNTMVYVACVVPISTCLAVVIAYLINQKIRGAGIFQTAFFMPMVTSITAVGLAWKLMFNKNFGIINYILSWFNVNPVNWLDNPSWLTSVMTLVIFGIWNILPFTIILLLSGLQNIDDQYYTAAKIDGAKSGRLFFRITVPLLAPTIFLVCIVNTISSFKVFSELYPLFKGKPGPYNNLYTVVYYIRYAMMENNDYGIAAAGAIILFLFIFVFTMLQLAVQRYMRKRTG